ncbi:hypothetical protein POMI540_2820 [Schizosaccharomyces pombe]
MEPCEDKCKRGLSLNFFEEDGPSLRLNSDSLDFLARDFKVEGMSQDNFDQKTKLYITEESLQKEVNIFLTKIYIRESDREPPQSHNSVFQLLSKIRNSVPNVSAFRNNLSILSKELSFFSFARHIHNRRLCWAEFIYCIRRGIKAIFKTTVQFLPTRLAKIFEKKASEVLKDNLLQTCNSKREGEVCDVKEPAVASSESSDCFNDMQELNNIVDLRDYSNSRFQQNRLLDRNLKGWIQGESEKALKGRRTTKPNDKENYNYPDFSNDNELLFSLATLIVENNPKKENIIPKYYLRYLQRLSRTEINKKIIEIEKLELEVVQFQMSIANLINTQVEVTNTIEELGLRCRPLPNENE